MTIGNIRTGSPLSGKKEWIFKSVEEIRPCNGSARNACFDSFIVDAPTGLRTTELSKSDYIGNSRSADEMVPPFPSKHAGGVGIEI